MSCVVFILDSGESVVVRRSKDPFVAPSHLARTDTIPEMVAEIYELAARHAITHEEREELFDQIEGELGHTVRTADDE